MTSNDGKTERGLVFFFRIAMAWMFLYAASHQLFDPSFSAAAFLAHTKTFHNFFAFFATPAMIPVTNFLVEWGHFLIGLSLLSGFLVRVSAPFGMLLMATYYLAHMDFPYIESKNNFLIDYHIVYIGILVYLVVKHAGHVWGLDRTLQNSRFGLRYPRLARAVG